MKRRWLLFLLGGLLAGVLLGWVVLNILPAVQETAVERKLPPTVGSAVADFTLSKADGSSFQLSKARGRPVVINFWATWCEPCKQEMPLLQQYHEKSGEGFQVIGVDYQEEAEKVQAFAAAQGITFPLLLDTDGAVADTYFVRNFPVTFFVDENGVLRGWHLGQLAEDELVDYLSTIGIEP